MISFLTMKSSPGFKLFADQEDTLRRLDIALESNRAVALVCPTGSGKTVMFTNKIKRHDGYAAAIAHRREITGQISKALGQQGVKHRVVAPSPVVALIRRQHIEKFGKSWVDQHARVAAASVQTLTSAASLRNPALQAFINQCTLAVFDEGHHYIRKGSWAKAVEGFPLRCKLIMPTATPERADGTGLGAHAGGYCTEIVQGPSTLWLMDNDRLCKYRYVCPDSDIDLNDIRLSASGDATGRELRKREEQSHLVGDVVSHYVTFANGTQCIVFASSVQTATEMRDRFVQRGIPAEVLTGETDGLIRERTIVDFERRKVKVLINVDLFDEGFDVPAVESVILARATWSLSKYLQQCGRALRYLPGKVAIIIDPVGNWERHGQPIMPRKWSLDDSVRHNDDDTMRLVRCNRCLQPFEPFHEKCPYCGAPVENVRRAPSRYKGLNPADATNGDLTELDIDAIARILRTVESYNMTDAEYRIDMCRRRVPPIGHRRELEAYRRARKRREALDELLKWWVGMQPEGRTLAEKQRRFYARYGVDMAHALALPERDTIELFNCVTRHFEDDMY